MIILNAWKRLYYFCIHFLYRNTCTANNDTISTNNNTRYLRCSDRTAQHRFFTQGETKDNEAHAFWTELHALQQIQMVDCQTCHVCSQLNNNLSSLFPRLDGNLLLLTEGTKASKTCLMLYPYIFRVWSLGDSLFTIFPHWHMPFILWSSINKNKLSEYMYRKKHFIYLWQLEPDIPNSLGETTLEEYSKLNKQWMGIHSLLATSWKLHKLFKLTSQGN